MRVAPPEWHQPPPSANEFIFILLEAMLWLSESLRWAWSVRLYKPHANLAQTWLCITSRKLRLHLRQHCTTAPPKNSFLECIQFTDQTRHRPLKYYRLDCHHSYTRLRKVTLVRLPRKSRMSYSNLTWFVWLYHTYAYIFHPFNMDTHQDFLNVKLPFF